MTATPAAAPPATLPGPVAYPVLEVARPAVPDPHHSPGTVVREWRVVVADTRLPRHIRFQRAAEAMIPDALAAAQNPDAPYTDIEGAAWRLASAEAQYQQEIAGRAAAWGLGITPTEDAMTEARRRVALEAAGAASVAG